MKCPNCGFNGEEGSLDCPACGIVFDKWRKRHPEASPPTPEHQSLPRDSFDLSPEPDSSPPLQPAPPLPAGEWNGFSTEALLAFRGVYNTCLVYCRFLRDSWVRWMKSQAKNRAEERILISALVFTLVSLLVFSAGLWVAHHPQLFENARTEPIPPATPTPVSSTSDQTPIPKTPPPPEEAALGESPPAEEAVPEEPPPTEEPPPAE